MLCAFCHWEFWAVLKVQNYALKLSHNAARRAAFFISNQREKRMSLRYTFEDCAVQSIEEILEDVFPNRQLDLDEEVARATGVGLAEVRRRGFGPLTSFPVERDPEDLFLDWDELDMERNGSPSR